MKRRSSVRCGLHQLTDQSRPRCAKRSRTGHSVCGSNRTGLPDQLNSEHDNFYQRRASVDRWIRVDFFLFWLTVRETQKGGTYEPWPSNLHRITGCPALLLWTHWQSGDAVETSLVNWDVDRFFLLQTCVSCLLNEPEKECSCWNPNRDTWKPVQFSLESYVILHPWWINKVIYYTSSTL